MEYLQFVDLLPIAVVGIVCGSIAQFTSGYSRGGWIVHLGIGFAGALLGTYLSRALDAPVVYDIPIGGSDFPVIWSLVGSVFCVAAIGFLVKPSRH